MSRARHHPRWIDAGTDQLIEQIALFVDRERIRLGIRPEHGETDVVGEQPAAMPR